MFWLVCSPTHIDMIQSFKDARAEKLMGGQRVVELVNIEEQVRTRLIRLDSAASLEDLRALRGQPPGSAERQP
jgi:plasmid maintenance system killer protein